jgi:ribosomal protein S18 acetylase RimI-like enzyme
VTRVVVRRVVPDEWETFRDIRLAALADAPGAFITTLAEARAFPEQRWRTQASEGGTMLAWRDDKPVGLVAVYVPEDQPHLVMMWVEPAARGTGVVEALIDAVVAWAGERQAAHVGLWVVEGNDRAERVYHRYGFHRTGRTQPVPGRPDEVELELTLLLHDVDSDTPT